MVKLGGIFAAAGLLAMALATPASANSVNGLWLRASTGAHIEVFDCDEGIGMKVVKSPDAEKVGKQIMCGAKPDGDAKWRGDLLNLEDGKTYTGIVTLEDAKSMKLQGCVLGGIICKSDIWTRIE